jgi:hypothetical protein
MPEQRVEIRRGPCRVNRAVSLSVAKNDGLTGLATDQRRGALDFGAKPLPLLALALQLLAGTLGTSQKGLRITRTTISAAATPGTSLSRRNLRPSSLRSPRASEAA